MYDVSYQNVWNSFCLGVHKLLDFKLPKLCLGVQNSSARADAFSGFCFRRRVRRLLSHSNKPLEFLEFLRRCSRDLRARNGNLLISSVFCTVVQVAAEELVAGLSRKEKPFTKAETYRSSIETE